jgi:hypothetical protein
LEFWLVSFVGGFVGSVFMDIAEAIMAKFGIGSGVTGEYIGRWVNGLFNGVLKHQNIADTAPANNEIRIGQIFHFVVGGGVVALFYPLFLEVIGPGSSSSHFILATIFGLITSVLPWFILMPSFGWGIFGVNAPSGSRPVISPILSHIPYGLGIGLTLVTYYEIAA